MYPTPLAKRQVLKGAIRDYGFDLISKSPTADELKKWGIKKPKGNDYTIEEVYAHALKCVKKYWKFEATKESGDLALESGKFTTELITPERITYAWLALAKYESGDRDNNHFPRQFFNDIDVKHNGKKSHYNLVPLFARNVKDGVSEPNLMSAGCLAYGMGNISAYCGIMENVEMARRAAWDWKYNVELSVMTLSRKWYVAEANNRGLPLDAAIICYHGWDGKEKESCEEYLARTKIDKSGKEERSSKRYYDAVKELYVCTLADFNENIKEVDDDIPIKEVIVKDETMNIKDQLGKIGVRGGHAVNENSLPLEYGYPAYIEGKYVHNLSQSISEEFDLDNLEPETEKLQWSVIAKRGCEAKCDTILYNHTNFSINSKGKLNSGVVVIIYPFENEEYKPMYEKMAEILAKHMQLPKWETRIRMSTNYENKNYYSALHYGMKYGISHPLIVEYGYHVDIAGKEEERTQQILAAYREMLEIDPAEGKTPIEIENIEFDLAGLRNRLTSVSNMIDELLDMINS